MNFMIQRMTKYAAIVSVIFILLSSLGYGSIPQIDRLCSAQLPGDNITRTEFIPERLNFTIDSFNDIEIMRDTMENLSVIKVGIDGKLRLSTSLPDISITGTYSSDEPIYAETLTLKAGASLIPSGNGDSIEMYARNLVMERGSLIDVSGRGDVNLGEGEDANDADRYWRGGGGGGGGGYGGEGADGGDGGGTGGLGGDGGENFGEIDDYDISAGSKGGEGGDSSSNGAKGGDGGGVIKLVAENIFINSTIKSEGTAGSISANSFRF